MRSKVGGVYGTLRTEKIWVHIRNPKNAEHCFLDRLFRAFRNVHLTLKSNLRVLSGVSTMQTDWVSTGVFGLPLRLRNVFSSRLAKEWEGEKKVDLPPRSVFCCLATCGYPRILASNVSHIYIFKIIVSERYSWVERLTLVCESIVIVWQASTIRKKMLACWAKQHAFWPELVARWRLWIRRRDLKGLCYDFSFVIHICWEQST